jgi:membrane protein YqaA with SNARE-associated domain
MTLLKHLNMKVFIPNVATADPKTTDPSLETSPAGYSLTIRIRMKSALLGIYAMAANLGGFGLILVGVMDSSFLFMPLGNDLLMLGLTAKHHNWLLYYAAMASAGSVAGCFLVESLARKGGEEGLSRFLPPKRIERVKRKVAKGAGWAIALSSLMPPPFPFTAFVAAAAALQYPRKRLLSIILATRFLRFCAIGLLAVFFGERILQIAGHPVVEYTILGLVCISIVGSAISVYHLIRRSRSAARDPAAA